MAVANSKSMSAKVARIGLATAMLVTLAVTSPLIAKDRKKTTEASLDLSAERRKLWDSIDASRIVWPNPPAIARIRYVKFWSGEKFTGETKAKKKAGWMERVSGVAVGEEAAKQRWQLVVPNGVASDSKGRIYVADSKVRAIFIVNTETGELQMLKNGSDARFQWLTGLAIDEADRLFVSDSGMKRVLIFDSNHKVEGQITEGLLDPGGIAIDEENRLLYISDAEQDIVRVFDADPPYKKIRTIGKEGTKHTSTVPGEFAKPTGVAVDKDGNLYVADTWNDRVEVFDAEGKFIRSFGKPGDGPGYFARPKGIAVDHDGHVWVADTVQARVQAFTPEGRLLIYMGESGMLPGQFQGLVNLTIDKFNRILTTEQYPGRVQIFRYVTDEEAKTEKDQRDVDAKKRLDEKRANTKSTASADTPPPSPETKH